ncbi:MAG: purine nucleoside permease [Burkholderiaceae bacterium]|nr:purine nucleoside permease [Burkholderiaceae bacterium]
MKVRGMVGMRGLLAVLMLLLSIHVQAGPKKPLPVRVVVVTTFELGEDSGDVPGEFQAWVERFPLPQKIAFPQGYRPLRYNPQKQVLGIVTGEGSLRGAASIMALGMDPRFDLSKAYWVVAGIAGIDPAVASVGSAAWAEWIIDRDLSFEIDARDIPPDWPTGRVPLGRRKPFEQPAPELARFGGVSGYHLNPGLVNWAFELTRNVALEDTAKLQSIRARYPDYPNGQKPPFVLKGDETSASAWWLGDKMNTMAQQWVSYWTGGKGVSTTTAMEDCGILQSLSFLAQTGRVKLDHVLVLRTGANYTIPAQNETAAQLLAQETAEDDALSGYIPSLEAAYRVASPVVNELSGHWDKYRDRLPGADTGTGAEH